MLKIAQIALPANKQLSLPAVNPNPKRTVRKKESSLSSYKKRLLTQDSVYDINNQYGSITHSRIQKRIINLLNTESYRKRTEKKIEKKQEKAMFSLPSDFLQISLDLNTIDNHSMQTQDVFVKRRVRLEKGQYGLGKLRIKKSMAAKYHCNILKNKISLKF